mgnify:CR=1 FL=1
MTQQYAGNASNAWNQNFDNGNQNNNDKGYKGRVRASIRRQCEGWIAGTYRGLIRNGHDPAWVRWSGSAWEIVPERASAVRRAIALFRSGEGATRIMRTLNAEGLRLTERGGGAAQIYRTIRLPALVGIKRIELDGEHYALTDYYPSIISPVEFADLQHLASDRGRRRGRGEIVGLITGMGRTICGYCGSAMVAQNLMHRAKSDGTLSPGHRRLMCVAQSHAQACPVPGSVSVVPIEIALLRYCSDQINLSDLQQGDSQADNLRAHLAVRRLGHLDHGGQVANRSHSAAGLVRQRRRCRNVAAPQRIGGRLHNLAVGFHPLVVAFAENPLCRVAALVEPCRHLHRLFGLHRMLLRIICFAVWSPSNPSLKRDRAKSRAAP